MQILLNCRGRLRTSFVKILFFLLIFFLLSYFCKKFKVKFEDDWWLWYLIRSKKWTIFTIFQVNDFAVGFIKVIILNQVDHNVIAPSIIRDCRDGFYRFRDADLIRVQGTRKPTVSHLVMGTWLLSAIKTNSFMVLIWLKSLFNHQVESHIICDIWPYWLTFGQFSYCNDTTVKIFYHLFEESFESKLHRKDKLCWTVTTFTIFTISSPFG